MTKKSLRGADSREEEEYRLRDRTKLGETKRKRAMKSQGGATDSDIILGEFAL